CFADRDVVVLKDAEKGAIETAIYHLFANRKPDDLLLFYFSGHGVTDDRRDFYFTGTSTSKEALPPTAVSSVYVQSEMDKSRSQSQVAILDCCHSGIFPKGMKAKDIGKVDIKLGGEGRAILMAADSSYAFEQEGFELSLYTHFLVEGLKTGVADRDKDGYVSAHELHLYVEGKVKNVNNSMSPKYYGQKEGHLIVLAKAAQESPKLMFRNEVEKVVRRNNGKISTIAGKLLIEKSQGLDPLEIESIIREVQRPYEEYQKKLEKYKQDLTEMLAEEFPVSEVTQMELLEYENHLGLREKDKQIIKTQILEQKESMFRQRERQESNEILEIDDFEMYTETINTSDESWLYSSPTNPNKFARFPQNIKSLQSILSRRNVLITGILFLGLGSFWQTLRSSISPTSETITIFPLEIVTLDKFGAITLKERRPKIYSTLNIGNGIILDMAEVPAGSFKMGMSLDERKTALENARKYGLKIEEEKRLDSATPIHNVIISAFEIGKNPVTNTQWQSVMGTNPSQQYDSKFQGKYQPVVGISWHDANEFCKRISAKTGRKIRLPTEAEWEYACRAGTTTPFHFGETITPDFVNYNGNFPYGEVLRGEDRQKTVEVDSFSPNPWGIYQMHGNVWEWCLDEWNDSYSSKPNRLKNNGNESWDDLVTGKENNRSHILRGGSWLVSARDCRSASRNKGFANKNYGDVGFRIVISS
ncbi:MAG: hypothetical protein RLZZ29_1891, partial [Cyanobacteriota bacterium]